MPVAIPLFPEKPKLSPMLAQYVEFKNRYPDYVIFYQVGDFYEIFFEDAVLTARALNITLTSRDKVNPVPMCGVPVHAIDNYLSKFIDLGFSAILVSQEPVLGKNGVSRFIERIVTPGARLFEAQSKSSSKLASVVLRDRFSLASVSIEEGILITRQFDSLDSLVQELKRLGSKELIVPLKIAGERLDHRTGWIRTIQTLTGTSIKFRELDSSKQITLSENVSVDEKDAAKLLVDFVEEVSLGKGNLIRSIEPFKEDGRLLIDARTRDNLELIEGSLSLFSFLNRTKSVLGERVLKSWIEAPLNNIEEIKVRQDCIEYIRDEFDLSIIPDLERIAARIELGIVTPLELSAVRDALKIKLDCRGTKFLEDRSTLLTPPKELLELLDSALADNPSGIFTEGSVIRDGYHVELDSIRALRNKGRAWVTELERKERETTGISSLKLRFTQAFGFFIEVTNANLSKVPSHYKRRQTTVGGERFTTDELQAKEGEIRGAEQREVELQRMLFEEVRLKVKPFASDLRRIGKALGEIDAISTLAKVARDSDFVRPYVCNETTLSIEDGIHPCFKGNFVSNSLPNHKSLILTGPNMGGKSTYLRQAALIVVLAHMGSFVPAKFAKVGLVDRLFARIGASDNPSEGESTFMVEMKEASQILSFASERSFVLIDELGRGTSTSEGLAIASAVVEELIKRGVRFILATHFHELTELQGVKNLRVEVLEQNGTISFPHKVVEGAGLTSYGIEVARLAGVPEEVLERAEVLLINPKGPITVKPIKKEPNPQHLKLIRKIKSIDPNSLTPINALMVLSELKEESESL